MQTRTFSSENLCIIIRNLIILQTDQTCDLSDRCDDGLRVNAFKWSGEFEIHCISAHFPNCLAIIPPLFQQQKSIYEEEIVWSLFLAIILWQGTWDFPLDRQFVFATMLSD